MIKYEDLVNKRYKEPEDGKFEDATKEILEAVYLVTKKWNL